MDNQMAKCLGVKQVYGKRRGPVWKGNFERAFVRLSGAFGRTWDTQVGNGKEFPTEQPNICYGPL